MADDGSDYLRLQARDASTCFANGHDWFKFDGADRAVEQRAFGGQLIAHCIMAAARDTPEGWSCHSCHIHFLREGRMVYTNYVVAQVRTGRSYALIRVDGFEDAGRQVVSAMVSFCRPECGPTVPACPIPTGLLPYPEACRRFGAHERWPQAIPADHSGRRWYVAWEHVDGRGCPLNDRSAPIAHAAALGFLSDFNFLWFAYQRARRLEYDLRMLASLDHVLHIHEAAFDASQPMLYEVDAPFAAGGRALVRGRLWSVGMQTLIASTTQEGVLRLQARRSPTGNDLSKL